MNNEELIQFLDSVHDMPNYCDRIVALKNFEKQYKKTEFYRQTHMSLQQLYMQYTLEQTLTLRIITKNINEMFNNIDADQFIAMMDEVNTKTADFIDKQKTELMNNDFMNILMGFAANKDGHKS